MFWFERVVEGDSLRLVLVALDEGGVFGLEEEPLDGFLVLCQ